MRLHPTDGGAGGGAVSYTHLDVYKRQDLDPALFHQSAHPSVELTDPRMDTLDLELIRRFAAKGKPILGICRGIQSINVVFGGTLIQDLNTQYPAMRPAGHQQHKAEPKPVSYTHLDDQRLGAAAEGL